MSQARVLVGTRKGAFILTADGTRKTWDVSGPHFGGWEIYHVKGSPVDPNRIYASQAARSSPQKIHSAHPMHQRRNWPLTTILRKEESSLSMIGWVRHITRRANSVGHWSGISTKSRPA